MAVNSYDVCDLNHSLGRFFPRCNARPSSLTLLHTKKERTVDGSLLLNSKRIYRCAVFNRSFFITLTSTRGLLTRFPLSPAALPIPTRAMRYIGMFCVSTR